MVGLYGNDCWLLGKEHKCRSVSAKVVDDVPCRSDIG